MSVIENTLKRLQGQRPPASTPLAEADGKGYGSVAARSPRISLARRTPISVSRVFTH